MNWIWLNENSDIGKTQFAEFKQDFAVRDCAKMELKISADFRYVAYVNGSFVGNGQYADLPDHKSVDTHDITSFVKNGDNVLTVVAWHMGQDFSVCRTMPAAVAFEVVADGKQIASSCQETLCRVANAYVEGDLVTPQIGRGYNLDFTVGHNVFQKAVIVNTGFVVEPRPIPNLVVSQPHFSTVATQGVFKLNGGDTVAAQMQNAWLRTLRFADMTGKERTKCSQILQPLSFFADTNGADGVFVTVDLGKETCGHLTFDITVDKPCTMYLGWGEHLADLRVRTSVGPRNFASSFTLKAGKNEFCDYLRRVGARYLTVYLFGSKVEISRLSIAEVDYPFTMPEKHFEDKLLDKIYQTARRTLQLSAHEHYEDCPWREQALYGMDSRNQMLFGYGAFGEYRLPRALLKLMALSAADDGLIPLCAPAEMSITIPSFSAYWLIAFCENAAADYDDAFVAEMLPFAEKMCSAFLARADRNGVSVFTQTRYWNFHEWTDGLDGGEIFRSEEIPLSYDCALTALVAKALRGIAELEARQHNTSKQAEYAQAAKMLVAAVDNFYDEKDGLYASYVTNGQKVGKHCYTQAAVLFADCAVDKEKIANLCDVLRRPDGKAADITLAALQLKYDALVRYANDKQYCIDETVRIFGNMVCGGATSFWETANGEADFEDAGSLCHGWSAVACYVLDNYLKQR